MKAGNPVVKCTCKHEFQDATYGKGMRVTNPVGKTAATVRCTVCSAIHNVAPKGKK